MSAAIFVLAFALGWLLRAATRVPPSVVTLERGHDDWFEIDGVRERINWTPAQVRGLLDRLAAAERERRTLIGLLADYRQEEVRAERELRLIRGGEDVTAGKVPA